MQVPFLVHCLIKSRTRYNQHKHGCKSKQHISGLFLHFFKFLLLLYCRLRCCNLCFSLFAFLLYLSCLSLLKLFNCQFSLCRYISECPVSKHKVQLLSHILIEIHSIDRIKSSKCYRSYTRNCHRMPLPVPLRLILLT